VASVAVIAGESLLTANVRSVLCMRQWRGVSSGPCGGTLLTVDVCSVLSTRQRRGVGCGPSVESESSVDTKARSKSAQLGSGGMRPGRGAWTKGVGAEMKGVGAEGLEWRASGQKGLTEGRRGRRTLLKSVVADGRDRSRDRGRRACTKGVGAGGLVRRACTKGLHDGCRVEGLD
jgi:hypothetical protein